MSHWVKAITGPKGKIVTAYAVENEQGEVARFRIRVEGKGIWRYARTLAQGRAARLNGLYEGEV